MEAEVITAEAPVEVPPEASVDAPAELGTTESDAAENADAKPEPTPVKADTGLSKREARAIRRLAEERARADYLQRQLDDTNKRFAPPVDPGEPKMENFSDIEEYAQAKAKYALEKQTRDFTQKQQKDTHETYVRSLSTKWDEGAAKAEGKYDDFHEVVGELKPEQPFAVAIMESEIGPEIAYYLGKHMDEARAIIALQPIGQARAIGRLEAKLLAEPQKRAEPSKAPEPIKPVTADSANVQRHPGDMSFTDFAAWRKKYIKAR